MEKAIVQTPTLAPPYAPYAAGVKVKKVGTFVFISGVVPNDVNGKIVFKGDIRKQMGQVLDNLKVTLEAAGATFKDVIVLTTYVTDMRDYLESKTDHWYLAHFNNPAETLIGVKDLANVGQMCEVSAIAVIE
jgi:2-iminobutanoate/2-iminopropanoate deaminase